MHISNYNKYNLFKIQSGQFRFPVSEYIRLVISYSDIRQQMLIVNNTIKVANILLITVIKIHWNECNQKTLQVLTLYAVVGIRLEGLKHTNEDISQKHCVFVLVFV